MKKLCIVLFLLIATTAFGQQKYALVIGNGNYTSFGKLPNAVNDANDVAVVLEGLGFNVDKIIDGSRADMALGITRLKSRLSGSKNSYGFFYYAGHGLQNNGINYLIPAKADIPNAHYLGDTSISVQTMLAELNDAENELNIIVLDACRDFPASWSRSMNRGLTVVSNQPADSIIVYATSAGSVASDGTDRNGLFTSHLLTQLSNQDISVRDIFDRTGLAVSQASNRQQIPAIYSQYFGTAYLGNPSNQQAETVSVQPSNRQTENVQPAHQPIIIAEPDIPNKNRKDNEGGNFILGIQVGPQFCYASNFEGLEATGNTGFYTSIYGAYAFTPLFSLQTGVAFSFNNGRHASFDYGPSEERKFTVMNIPILPTFTFHPMQNLSIRLNLGPLFSFTLTDMETQYSDGTMKNETIDIFSFGAGVGIGLGYKIGRGNIVFDVRGIVPISSFFSVSSDWLQLHNGLPLLLLGYEFCF